jgi:stearoyl-CoA desaturase (delta-9 desaturase)
MKLKLKFFQQQILTSLGLLGVFASIVFSIIEQEYGLLVLSFIYSQFIVFLLGTQIVLHRYFSHRSFEVKTYIKHLFLVLSFLPGQGSPIAWAAAHRHHHKHSDSELDNHSPTHSYFLAAGGWLLKGYRWIVDIKKLKTIPTDLLRVKILVELDRHYYTIWWILLLAGTLINYKLTLFFLIAPIGWTLLLSSLVTLGCHIKLFGGYRNFTTKDNSHNNLILQCIVLGDALHNNHHQHPNAWNNSIKQYEFDPAAKIISLLKNK